MLALKGCKRLEPEKRGAVSGFVTKGIVDMEDGKEWIGNVFVS